MDVHFFRKMTDFCDVLKIAMRRNWPTRSPVLFTIYLQNLCKRKFNVFFTKQNNTHTCIIAPHTDKSWPVVQVYTRFWDISVRDD